MELRAVTETVPIPLHKTEEMTAKDLGTRLETALMDHVQVYIPISNHISLYGNYRKLLLAKLLKSNERLIHIVANINSLC